MNIKEIIIAYLKENGFDGLCNPPDCDCGCGLDDLFPCDRFELDCQPAYKHKCPVHGTIYGPDKESANCAYCAEAE